MGDEEKDWGRFTEVDNILVVYNVARKVEELLKGFYVIGLLMEESGGREDFWSLICADDPPMRRIRTFPTFAGARRFMSSLALRGVTKKMKVVTGNKVFEQGV